MEIKSLFEAVSRAENASVRLEGAVYALRMLGEAMEEEDRPQEKKDELWSANMEIRFPMFLATYRIISREIERISQELPAAVNCAYAACKQQEAQS